MEKPDLAQYLKELKHKHIFLKQHRPRLPKPREVTPGKLLYAYFSYALALQAYIIDAASLIVTLIMSISLFTGSNWAVAGLYFLPLVILGLLWRIGPEKNLAKLAVLQYGLLALVQVLLPNLMTPGPTTDNAFYWVNFFVAFTFLLTFCLPVSLFFGGLAHVYFPPQFKRPGYYVLYALGLMLCGLVLVAYSRQRYTIDNGPAIVMEGIMILFSLVGSFQSKGYMYDIWQKLKGSRKH